MGDINYINEIFDKQDPTNFNFDSAEFESCTFSNCNFQTTNLSTAKFFDCKFSDCDLSLIKLNKSLLNDIKFQNCKMLGVNFEPILGFSSGLVFENCTLNHSSFYSLKIKKTVFRNCNLSETDFTECDLTNSIFDKCNLTQAIFENTILEKADLRTSYNFIINPEINKIKKAIFALEGLPGLLTKYNIIIE